MKPLIISHNLPQLFASAQVTNHGPTILVKLVDSKKSSIPFFRDQRIPHLTIPCFEKLIKPTPFQKEKKNLKSLFAQSETRDDNAVQLIVRSRSGSRLTYQPQNKSFTTSGRSKSTKAGTCLKAYETNRKSKFLLESKGIEIKSI